MINFVDINDDLRAFFDEIRKKSEKKDISI
jgi:hypothetical protein